ncbi:MAG TPA: hypothetical protein VF160_03670 [Candidatus Dormibacteraeota bacterium]
MSIDIQEIQEGVAEAQETVADVATGAIVDVVDKATHPITSVRRTARRLERKGDPVNTQIKRQVTRTRHEVEDAVEDVVSGNLAERVAIRSLRATKNRARRLDIVGDVLYVGLSLFHRGVGGTRRRLSKLEDASQPPARNGSTTRTASPSRRRTRTSTRSRRRKTAA